MHRSHYYILISKDSYRRGRHSHIDPLSLLFIRTRKSDRGHSNEVLDPKDVVEPSSFRQPFHFKRIVD